MKIKSLLGLCLIALTGCAYNLPVDKFYTDMTAKVPPQVLAERFEPSSPNPEIFSSTDPMKDSRSLSKKGYMGIGYTDFSTAYQVSKEDLLKQAKKVGADVVLYTSRFSHQESGAVPVSSVTMPQTSTTTYQGSSTYGNFSGSSTTQTPPSVSTSWIPYQSAIYNYSATYWRKLRPPILGVMVGDVPEDIRSKLQRNSGACIDLVMDNSPAFKANLLEKDVIVKINDLDITTPQTFYDNVAQFQGQKVSITFARDGKYYKTDIQLNGVYGATPPTTSVNAPEQTQATAVQQSEAKLPVAEKAQGTDPAKVYFYSPYDSQKRVLTMPKEYSGQKTVCPFTNKPFMVP